MLPTKFISRHSMAIKKHKVKIKVVNDAGSAPAASAFVVDLKNDYRAEPSGFDVPSLSPTSDRPNSDFLAASKRSSELLNFKEEKMEQMLFYPLWQLLRRGFSYMKAGARKLNFNFPRIRFPRLRFRFKFTLPKIRKARAHRPLINLSYQAPHLEIIETEEPSPPSHRWRSVLLFALVLLLLIIPFKILSYYKVIRPGAWQDSLLGVSKSGAAKMISGSESALEFRLGEASQNFTQASLDFVAAQEQMKEIDELVLALATFSQNDNIKLASQSKKLLAAGEIGARLGNDLALAVDSLLGPGQMNEPLAPRLANFVRLGRRATVDVEDLKRQIDKVNVKYLPADYQQKFSDLKSKLDVLQSGLGNFVSLAAELDEFLGANQDKRYLLVFQNNNEMRASGGFIGSYALLDVSEGKIKNIEVPAGGSYDTAGGLRELVAAPEPLWLVNPLWHFWDANWWPDWPLSAKNLMWFLEKSDGPSVDGVVAFTPTVIEKLLAVTGPIDLTEKYGVTIDADNFWAVTQGIIEKTGNPELYASSTTLGQKLDQAIIDNEDLLAQQATERPKEIIGDLMDKILLELPRKLDKANLGKLLRLADECLNEKQVLFYFSDSALEQKMIENFWAGKMKSAPNDYLSLINTNIAGGKSDRMIEETINHKVEVQSDGSIIDTLTVTRSHRGVRGEPFTGMRNVDWMRFYVPKGSELLAASGFSRPDEKYFEAPDPAWTKNELLEKSENKAQVHESSGTKIYTESGKTVFANWSMVDPGESVILVVKYRLPFKLRRADNEQPLVSRINRWFKQEPIVYTYSLLVEKQPGAKASNYQGSLSLVQPLDIFWKYPDNLAIMDSSWQIFDRLNSDKYYKILLR